MCQVVYLYVWGRVENEEHSYVNAREAKEESFLRLVEREGRRQEERERAGS